MRIVSLVPSATETLIAWGVDPIAVTRFCERGDEFQTVGGTKDPAIDRIVSMRPDLVVMCDQENRNEDARALRDAEVPVYAFHITRIDHVVDEMARLAETVGVSKSFAERCTPDVSNVLSMRAYIPIWKRPWMTVNGDTYGSSLLAALGVTSIVADHDDRYPMIDLEQAAALRPDIVVAPNEPYVFGERHRAELSTVAPVVFVDGKDLFWWGIRTPGAMQRLGAQLATST